MPESFALSAHPLVRWLLDSEPDVKRQVSAFCAGKLNGNILEVAGPPSDADLAQYRKNESSRVGLPCVRLTLSFVNHHLTGERGIRIDCQEAHIQEIARWNWRSYNRRGVAS